MLNAGNYDGARKTLTERASSDPASMNALGVLDALNLGSGADPARAYRLFHAAARAGNSGAQANLAICHLFGIGTALDPAHGARLLQSTIDAGLDVGKATWLLSRGTNLIQVDNFAEIIKSLHLLARQDSPVAHAILGVFAARGLTIPPCTLPCSEDVREHVEALRSKSETSLSALIDMSVKAQQGHAAVLEAARAASLAGTTMDPIVRWSDFKEIPRPEIYSATIWVRTARQSG